MSRAYGQLNADLKILLQHSWLTEPLFIALAAIQGIEQLSAHHLCTILLIAEFHAITALRMRQHRADFFLVR